MHKITENTKPVPENITVCLTNPYKIGIHNVRMRSDTNITRQERGLFLSTYSTFRLEVKTHTFSCVRNYQNIAVVYCFHHPLQKRRVFLPVHTASLAPQLATVGVAARSQGRHQHNEMSEEIDGPDKLNAAPGEAGNADGDNEGGSGPPMSMRGGRGGFR